VNGWCLCAEAGDIVRPRRLVAARRRPFNFTVRRLGCTAVGELRR
jgi:hypothetical protein